MYSETVLLKCLKRVKTTCRRYRRYTAYDDCRSQQLISLGNGFYGSPRSLIVKLQDSGHLMFNCGEGTVRAAIANYVQLPVSKLKNIFFTYKSWSNVGGLMNFVSCFKNSSTSTVVLHGPPHIEHICNLTNKMVVVPDIKIVKRDHEKTQFKQRDYEVNYVPLYAKDYDKLKALSPSATYNPIALAYICKGMKTNPKFDMKKCTEIGAELTPLLGKLARGEDVVLPNGTLVRSADVVDLAKDPPFFVVVECPDEDFLDSLLETSGFDRCYDGPDRAEAVVHFTSCSVMDHPKYRRWMNRFHNDVQHLLMNERCDSQYMWRHARLQDKLHAYDANVFERFKSSTNETLETDKIPPNRNEVLFNPLMTCQLRPYMDIGKWEKSIPSTGLAAPPIRTTSQRENRKELTGKTYPEVTFLGTSSRISSTTRNVSGILVSLSETQMMLLDCGEGIYGQLVSAYGKAGAAEVVKKLRCVFVSHSHMDHYLGLLELTLQRKRLLKNPPNLLLMLPKRLLYWLMAFGNFIEPLHCTQYMLNRDVVAGQLRTAFTPADQLGLAEVRPVPVVHCKDAHGIVIKDRNGFKLVYSGDTSPCDQLIDAGKDCDLLIHEATHESHKLEKCSKVNHTTLGGAIDVARRMRAKTTLVTHIATESSLFNMVKEIGDDPVGVAFDFMKVNPRNLEKIPELTKTIVNDLFKPEDEEEQRQETQHADNYNCEQDDDQDDSDNEAGLLSIPQRPVVRNT